MVDPKLKRPMVVDTEGTPLKLKAEKGPKQRSQERCKARTKAGGLCRAPATEGGLCFCHAHPEKLAELGDSCRQLLQLSWSGKPMDEVAMMLEVSYGYVRKKKSECMAKLISLVKRSSQYNALKW